MKPSLASRLWPMAIGLLTALAVWHFRDEPLLPSLIKGAFIGYLPSLFMRGRLAAAPRR